MKFLIIGLGSIGQRHASNLLNLGYKDIIALRSKKGTKPLDISLKCFGNLDKAYRQSPDIVLIANPTSLHLPAALEAAKRGCHIFIEKPLSCSLAGIKALQTLIRKNRLINFVAYNLRFHPAIAKIKQLVLSQFLGGIYFARLQFASYLPAWHPWEDYKKSYASRKDLGGGVILTSSHELDMLYWLFGKYKKINSTISKGKCLGISAEDIALIHIRFNKGILAEVNLSYVQQPPKRYIEIVGEKGVLFYDFYQGGLKFYSKNKKSWLVILKVKKDAIEKTYRQELLHFIDCVSKKKKTICPVNDGIEVLKMAMRAKINN